MRVSKSFLNDYVNIDNFYEFIVYNGYTTEENVVLYVGLLKKPSITRSLRTVLTLPVI